MKNRKRIVSALLATVMALPGIYVSAEESLPKTKTVEISVDNVVYGKHYTAPWGSNAEKQFRMLVNNGGSCEAYQNFAFAEFENIPDVDAIVGLELESTHSVRKDRTNGTFWYTTELPESIPEAGEYIALEWNSGKKYTIKDSEDAKTVFSFYEYIANQVAHKKSLSIDDATYEELSGYIGKSGTLYLSSDKKLVIQNPNFSKNYGGRLFNFSFNKEDGTHTMPVEGLTATSDNQTMKLRFNLTEQKGCSATGAWNQGITVIEALKNAKKEDGSGEIAFIMHDGENMNNDFSNAKIYVTYDMAKLFEMDFSKAASDDEIRSVISEYNAYIGADLNVFSDMSEVYEGLYEWKKTAEKSEFTYENVKTQFDLICGNLVVKNSLSEYGEEGEFSDIGDAGLSYTFEKTYASHDKYSTYIGFSAKEIGESLTFVAGDITLTINSAEGKAILSSGETEVTADIQTGFDGYISLKFLKNNGVLAVLANESERTVINLLPADFSYSIDGVSINAGNGAKVADLTVQQYTDDFEKAATDNLDAVLNLIEEGKRQEAVDSFDTAKAEVENMSEGIAKNELNKYSQMLLAKIEYAKQELLKAEAEALIEAADVSKKYADYEVAEESVKLVTEEKMLEDLNKKLSAVKEKLDKIVPYITGVVVEGSWKVGETLTAKITLQDDCGNGDGYNLVWIINGAESSNTSESFNVTSAYGGAKIILRATPKNKSGILGASKDSLTITIAKQGSGGGSSGGGSSVSYNIPVQQVQKVVDEVKLTNKIENEGSIFNDISGHWAEESINNMMKKSIVKGVTAYEFAPERKITRAEFVTLLLRALNEEEKEYSGEFTDVTADDWYANTVKTAYDLGLISGFNGAFNPDGYISRQEMAKLLVLAYENKMGEISTADVSYNDEANISDWAQIFVKKSSSVKIMLGDDNGCFNPAKGATRAEATVAIERFLNK